MAINKHGHDERRLLTRKGLLDTPGPDTACPKGVPTGLACPKAGKPAPGKGLVW